jgi:hypothetical protein
MPSPVSPPGEPRADAQRADLLPPVAGVDLYWLPLGAGDSLPVVRWSGRAFESLAAVRQHRQRCDLYHAALEIRIDGHRYVVEMTPEGSRVG